MCNILEQCINACKNKPFNISKSVLFPNQYTYIICKYIYFFSIRDKSESYQHVKIHDYDTLWN